MAARADRGGAVVGTAGCLRAAQPSGGRRDARRGRYRARESHTEWFVGRLARLTRACRRDRRRGLSGAARPGPLLRRAARLVGLWAARALTRRCPGAPGGHLPRHDGDPREHPGTPRVGSGAVDRPRPRLLRLLAPAGRRTSRRREPADRARGERRRPRAHGRHRDDDAHPRTSPPGRPVPAGQPGAKGPLFPWRAVRSRRRRRRGDGPAAAGLPGAGPTAADRRGRRDRRLPSGTERRPARRSRRSGSPEPRHPARSPCGTGGPTATPGAGMEEQPARPHSAQPAAQLRARRHPTATTHARRASGPARRHPATRR